jgi:hypothetical protein
MNEFPIEYYTEQGREVPSPTYTPGVDFDPNDPDDVEIVGLATEIDKYNRIDQLERENAMLREQFDDSDVDYEEEEVCDWATEQAQAYTD